VISIYYQVNMAFFQSGFIKSLLQISINRYSIFLLGMYLYTSVISSRGGINSELFFTQWFELLLLIYLYVYFYLILQPGRWRSIVAFVPVLLGYLVHDLYYLIYGKVFRLISVLELPELIQVIPFGYGLLAFIFIVLPLFVFIFVINYRNIKTIASGALPLMLLVGVIFISPVAYTDFIQKTGNGLIKYSDAKSVERNGRYTMMFYKEAERQNALLRTVPYRNRIKLEKDAEKTAQIFKKKGNQRNVHLIVLESFLDPRLFTRAHFSKPPAHPDFEKLFKEKIGLSQSPVFGGATAQAEFEVLCGVPAFEKLSSVEFNVFTGAPVYCLPGILGKAGYRTVATNAYKPNFFNIYAGYKGAGFNEVYFPKEFTPNQDTYLKTGDVGEEDFMFDGDLLDQNLKFIAKNLKQNPGVPIFNYVMTIYGHIPHILDSVKRPEVLQVISDYSDDHLQRSANQFYYRTQAIAQYVNKLIKLDKESLIILVSDHVPPLRNGPNTYRELHYMDNVKNSFYLNRLMIIENGKPVSSHPIKHYNLPDVVYNYISSGEFCRDKSCAFRDKENSPDLQSLLEKYYVLMSHASE